MPGFFKNYLQSVQLAIRNNKEYRVEVQRFNKQKVMALKDKTLWIPDYTKIRYNANTGEEFIRDNPQEFYEAYDYSYEVVPAQSISGS